MVHFIPTLDFKGKPGVYPCPVYKAPDMAQHGDVWLQSDSFKGLLLKPFAKYGQIGAASTLDAPPGFEQKGYIVHNWT